MGLPLKKIIFIPMLLVILATILVPIVNADQTYNQEGYRDRYVILTNIDENDHYFSGVSLLKDYRNASVIRFTDFINDTLPLLKKVKPYYIAVAVKPENITREFVEKTLDILRQIDNDDCIDSAVGFITAANFMDLENLVNNTIRAEEEQRPEKFVSMFYPREQSEQDGNAPLNPSLFSNAQTQTDFFSEIGWETSTVDTNMTSPSEIYSMINNSCFITLTMHGSGISVEGLTSSEVKAGPDQYLFPAVTIALPCYCACTDEKIVDGPNSGIDYIGIDYSFALSFIKKGAVGYIGHLRMAGVNLAILQPTLYAMAFLNMTQGEAMTYAYNKCLMVPAKPEPEWKIYLFDYLLYGDPAYKPVIDPLAAPILKEGPIISQNEIELELCFTRNVTLPTPLNPTGYYNDENKWSGLFALPLHYQYILPENYKVMSVSVSDFSDPDSKITQVNVQDWVIEETLDENILHIALDITWTDYRDICEGATISLNLGVTVIPEFSSIILLLLFMTAALIAVTVNRRKYAVKH